jgi:hypothetical protein
MILLKLKTYKDMWRLKSFNDIKTKDMKTFEVKSGKVVISDPCYTRDTWCQKVLDNVKNGEWIVNTELIGGRIGTLEAHVSGSNKKTYDYVNDLGVDSGQLGIFDDSIYPTGENTGEYDDKSSFYGKCCDKTLGDEQFGIVDNLGVVSSSGWGDGSYTACLGIDNEGKVVSIFVEFIGDEDDDDQPFEDEDYVEEDEDEDYDEVVNED